jgi:hypothetical protein
MQSQEEKMFDPRDLSDDPAEYWNHRGALADDYKRLRAALVPDFGMCETVEGELLRLASKIYYRHYNDGDVYTPESFQFLLDHVGPFDSYDEMIDKTVRHVLDRQEKYAPNEFDSVAAAEIDFLDPDPEEDEDEDEDDEEFGGPEF